MFQFILRKPVTSLVLSFAVIIFIGAVFLTLPFATSEGTSFLDALFTATSATCVTGLTVRDTGTAFTFLGQIIILVLIQLGGLGIMTAAASVFLVFKKAGIRAGASFKTILEEEYISGVKKAIKFIVINALILEAVGTLLLFSVWRGLPAGRQGDFFTSIFHSVSAFCNAGFSLFGNSLENFRGDISINVIFSLLIISGGIGFLVLEDLYKKAISLLRKERTRIALHSKIVLIATFSLILFGAALFYFFEKENLSGLTQKELILSSFFQSITSRTAGFNTVSIAGLTAPTLFLLTFLMFIGAAPGSAGGGVKVVSFALIFLAISSFLRKKDETVIFGRAIPKAQFRNVFILVSIYLIFCLFISLFLLYIEKDGLEGILFEVFSAMGTVGLSTGITPRLTDIGKILIIITMFTGRLLPLSIAILASREIAKTKIRHLEEKVILG